MNEYHQKMNEIEDLRTKKKNLSEEGLEYLKEQIREYQEREDKTDIMDCLPFIVLFVYNNAYNMAVEDVLRILRG